MHTNNAVSNHHGIKYAWNECFAKMPTRMEAPDEMQGNLKEVKKRAFSITTVHHI